MRDRLSPLQREILNGFCELAPEFYLTGGAALAGFHLGHRDTHDLDLFVADDHLDSGVSALREVGTRLGADLQSLQTAPGFGRFLVKTAEEGVVVDLARDPTPQGGPKLQVGSVRVDPPEEILANKLCSLLSRAELRDLVDVMALERAGYGIDQALELAARKDAGLTPGQLAWVLSGIEIGAEAAVPGDVAAPELAAYLEALRRRLERLALPD